MSINDTQGQQSSGPHLVSANLSSVEIMHLVAEFSSGCGGILRASAGKGPHSTKAEAAAANAGVKSADIDPAVSVTCGLLVAACSWAAAVR